MLADYRSTSRNLRSRFAQPSITSTWTARIECHAISLFFSCDIGYESFWTMGGNVLLVGSWNRGRPNKHKGLKLPPEPLSIAEVNTLLKQCGSQCSTGIRNRALIVTLWRAGLRISEALGLLPKDIDAAQCTIRVLKGKNKKSRVVGIDPSAISVIQRWLDRRIGLGIGTRSPVFCTLKGSPIATAYVRNLMKRLSRAAGITKRVHAHGLRHTCASELLEERTNIGEISKQLGHSDISTTARYLDHIKPLAVLETMRNRPNAIAP